MNSGNQGLTYQARVLAMLVAVVLLASATVATFAEPADAQVTERVLITEFAASNDSLVQDEDGETEDWIELFNPSNAGIDLAG